MSESKGLPQIILAGGLFALSLAACSNPDNANTTATTTVTPPPMQILRTVPRPQKILDMMKERGGQEEAKPVLRILSPAKGGVIEGSTVALRLGLAGDLRGYKPYKDPITGNGNHIHVILDNEPYEAYYDLSKPFELRGLSPGRHTIRVFASRPWHESYKNEGSFQMVSFTVKGDTGAIKSTVTNNGPAMANDNSNNLSQKAKETEELDPTKPLLTYSRPKGEYRGEDADPIMIDFWLSSAKLKGDGGEYLVRYFIDDDDARYIDRWEPIWLSGWTTGKHSVRLELLETDGKPLENGGYNITTREITVAH
jgi:hypothetical protein